MAPTILSHFIDGRSFSSTAGQTLSSHDPRTGGAVVAQLPCGSAEDVDAAVRSAAAAQAVWRSIDPMHRGRLMVDIARCIRRESPRLVDLEIAETGKPSWQAPMEVEGAAQYFEFFGGLSNLYEGEVINTGSEFHTYTLREPYGVIGVITPWNAPLNQAARAIAPALATGNTVVCKPSEFTSSTTIELARIAVECGLPAGVLNVVLGDGAITGSAVVAHPGVRKVAFTGSVRAGQEIGKIAAERILPLTLELGGKSANIVFEDADLSKAVPGAVAAFSGNAGQVCTAGTRLLVQSSIHDAFVDALVQAVSVVKVGPAPDARVGALITAAQYRRVMSYFDVARQDGARLLVGGPDAISREWGEGWYLPLTVYADVTPRMRVAREEIFGPVLVVIPFTDEDQAIRIANDSDYGLSSGVWTQNISRAHRVARALEAGSVNINQYAAGGVLTPMGGHKKSGYGREKGVEAMHHYTQLKCVSVKL